MFYPPKPYFLFMKNKLDFLSEHERGYFYFLFKGKHDTWLARELTTYKYENENACLDVNLRF
jgi:hypothetical protein